MGEAYKTSFNNPLLSELRRAYPTWKLESDGECTLGGAAAEVLGWTTDLESREGWVLSEYYVEFAVKVLKRLVILFY